ncbi:MAG: exodeoxyribonuclease III [Alphaproteobacteria bacterium]|nr:exodeoxyribonuclease III [Alphaproteobacteria bacterium]
MKIATYNVNSINARLEGLCRWLKTEQPDIVLLQEIKTEFNTFPFFEINAVGYDAKILGQKSYNGVAVLSPHKMTIIQENLPDFEDENARWLEVMVNIEKKDIRVVSLYLPNGNPPYNNPTDNSKLTYKLAWMDAFIKHTANLLHQPEPVILGGDYNIILTDDDVYNPALFKGGALYRPEVTDRLQSLLYQGWFDAFRLGQSREKTLSTKTENGYTYWDYGGGAFHSDLGLRIDYLLLSPKAADKMEKCWVDKTPRQSEKPSDHTALMAELNWGK